MLPQYIPIIFLPLDAIYFVKCTSPSCSEAPPQHDAATPVHHGCDGVFWLASLPLCPPNIMMVIMAKQFYFCFIGPEDISPKSTCAVANRSLSFFYGGFEAVASSWLRSLSGYVDIGLIFLWI
jgi:hypothetical protein